jgi:hypothetical protein
MKGKLTALIVGLVLGSTGVALGSSSIAPWQKSAPSYACHGYSAAAWCRIRYTPYESFVSRGRLDLVRRRLPRAVRPHKTDHTTGRNFERQVVHRHEIPEAPSQPVCR